MKKLVSKSRKLQSELVVERGKKEERQNIEREKEKDKSKKE